eukprot:286841-Rhodomonas_salina.2
MHSGPPSSSLNEGSHQTLPCAESNSPATTRIGAPGSALIISPPRSCVLHERSGLKAVWVHTPTRTGNRKAHVFGMAVPAASSSNNSVMPVRLAPAIFSWHAKRRTRFFVRKSEQECSCTSRSDVPNRTIATSAATLAGPQAEHLRVWLLLGLWLLHDATGGVSSASGAVIRPTSHTGQDR